MNKLYSLRAHLLSIPDELKIEPEDLITFGDTGRLISAAYGTNQHFELGYQANIIIKNFSGNSMQLLFWVLSWYHQKQPNHKPDEASFDVDLLNEKSVDVSFTLPLTETVKVEQTVDGLALLSVDDPDVEPVLLTSDGWAMFLGNEVDPAAEWVQGV